MSNFLAWFTLTNEDQSSMLPAVEIDGEPADEVAAQWVADNEDVWSEWLSGDPPPSAPAVVDAGHCAGDDRRADRSGRPPVRKPGLRPPRCAREAG